MPEDHTPIERGQSGPRGDRISETPARAKPFKLPDRPINGLGTPGEDEATAGEASPTTGGTAAPPPLAPQEGFAELEQRELQNLAKLKDLLRVMTRALKAKRMYPANNPLLQRILGECSLAFNETLEALGDIHFTVQQFDLLFLGQSVYHNPNRKESIAFRFSKDGITELVFQEGLPPDELEDFLSVMAHAMEPGTLEDDLVTLLWEQEFSHVTYAYLAIDDLQEKQEGDQTDEVEGDSEGEMSWPDSSSEPLDEATGVAWTEHHGWKDEGGGSGHRADDWNELEPVARVADQCSNEFQNLSAKEIEALAEEIHREHSRSMHEVVLEILTEVAEAETKPEAFADLARAFSDLLLVVVQEADLPHAVEIVTTLKTLSESRGQDPTGFLPDPRDLATQALAALTRHPEADPSLLGAFMNHLGPRTIEPMCDVIEDPDFHALHASLQGALVALSGQDLPAVRARIDKAPPAAARLLVQVLARVGTPEAEQALAASTSHPEARVRKEAISALAASGNARTRAYLLRALDDDDPQVRAAALHGMHEMLGQTKGESGETKEDRALAERVLAVLSGPRFAEQSAVERHSYFEMLVRIGGPIVLTTLDAWLGHWTLAGGGDSKARRELSAWALTQIQAPGARAILEKHAKSFIPAIRSTSKKALGDSMGRAA